MTESFDAASLESLRRRSQLVELFLPVVIDREKPPVATDQLTTAAEGLDSTKPLVSVELVEEGLLAEQEIPPASVRPSFEAPSYSKRTKNPDSAGEEQDLIKMYLDEIGKYPLLKKEDEISLAQAREAGLAAAARLADLDDKLTPELRQQLERTKHSGEEAQKLFIQSNYRLVVSIARRYQGQGLSLLDLVQEGNIGMMHAVELFDWRKGFKFSTYATWWIRQAVSRAINRSGGQIRLPDDTATELGQLMKAEAALQEESGRKLTDDELQAALGWSSKKLQTARMAERSLQIVYLDTPLDGGSSANAFVDLIGDPRSDDDYTAVTDDMDRTTGLEKALSVLSEKEQFVIRRYYGLDGGEPLSYTKVGQQLNMTSEGARKIAKSAMKKLRMPSNPGYSLLAGHFENLSD
jgi:RNA polymerase sigma factor (sigma-70 family)